MWRRVYEEGYGGKILRILKDMYRGNKGCFRFDGIKTKMMDRNRGVRQGCVLSPLLFSLYINKVVKELRDCGKGVWVGGVQIPLLVFADDIVLCASSRADLRVMMDILMKGMEELELDISEKKSMVMKCGEKQVWLEDDESEDEDWGEKVEFGDSKVIRLDNGSDYKYLGLMVSNLGTWFVGDREGDEVIMEKLRKVVGLIRGEAEGSYDRIFIGSKLWEAVAIPSVMNEGQVLLLTTGCVILITLIMNIISYGSTE